MKIMWKLKSLAISQAWRLMKADFTKWDEKKSRLSENKILLKEKNCCSNPAIICCNEY